MKSINNNAPVKCSKSIVIKASKEKVWEVLADINRWPDWQTDISYAKINTQLAPNATFDWKTGGAKIQSTLHTVEPPYHFGWTGKTVGLLAIHNWTLKVANEQTIVTVDESMEGVLAKIFKKSFNTSLERGMIRWLELLKAECEIRAGKTK